MKKSMAKRATVFLHSFLLAFVFDMIIKSHVHCVFDGDVVKFNLFDQNELKQ